MLDKVKLFLFWQEYGQAFSMLGGMLLQYVFGEKRGYKIILVIVLATLFCAFALLLPLMEVIKVVNIASFKISLEAGSPARSMILSLSSLISVMLIAFIMASAKVAKSVIRKRLGVKDD